MEDTFVDLIEAIEKRPAMYFGARSLSLLKAFLEGWEMGKKGEVPDREIMRDFQRWIQDRYKIQSTQSWAKIILFFSQDEADALDKFFRLFREFRSQ